MAHPLIRAVICTCAAGILLDLAVAQEPSTESKAPELKTAESKPSNQSAPTKVDSSNLEQTTIPITVTLPTVHVIGTAIPPETLKAARDAGYQIKVKDDIAHFCKTEAEVGTRFKTESCINEDKLSLVLHRSEEQRERLKSVLGAPSVTH